MPPHTPTCFVATVDPSLKEKLERDLPEQGFILSPAPHAFFSAKKGNVSCTLYLSGKIVVQGKDKEEFITYYLEPEILKNLSYTYPNIEMDATPRIGLDEAGKGDFFGPLCIAGFYAGEGQAAELIKMGVKDSKKINDETILTLSRTLKKSFPHKIIALFPETYNKLYSKFHNLNRMLAWGHATVLEELAVNTSCQKAVLDQFADASLMEGMLKQKKMQVDLLQKFRGEEDPVVAAASILARAAFVEGMAKLEERFQLRLPKGASSAVIVAAKKAVSVHGESILPLISKTHFKTTAVVLSHD